MKRPWSRTDLSGVSFMSSQEVTGCKARKDSVPALWLELEPLAFLKAPTCCDLPCSSCRGLSGWSRTELGWLTGKYSEGAGPWQLPVWGQAGNGAPGLGWPHWDPLLLLSSYVALGRPFECSKSILSSVKWERTPTNLKSYKTQMKECIGMPCDL